MYDNNNSIKRIFFIFCVDKVMTEKSSTEKVPGKIGNTIQSSAKLRWAFTLNNYHEEDVDYLCIVFNNMKARFVFGEEGGGEEKTPHLQGQVTFKKRKRLSALRKIDPRIHWEATRNECASIDYCQKEGGKVHTNIRLENADARLRIVWKPWQEAILKLVQTVPDSRTVHWYWEPTGNVGKSFLTKYLVQRFNALVVSGKANDIFHQFAKREEDGIATTIAVLDIPRCSMGFISYQAIESIKNGLITSGKYEGGQWIIDPCHVICFSNERPRYEAMSADRWNVVCLSGDGMERHGERSLDPPALTRRKRV